jgi:5-methylcytosine-specific restriction enzyme B
VSALAGALGARTGGEFEDQWPDAQSELAEAFGASTWGLSGRFEPYTEQNIQNLWKNELSDPVRTALEAQGVGLRDFSDWLGEVHYVYLSAYVKSLFERYQENRGWRVLGISIPALGVAAIGIASHYQQAQRHNRLAEVSNLLYDHAAAALDKQGIALPGRKIEQADWDGTGLMLSPIDEMCDVKLPDGHTARLKYARSTTVKKILASFIDVQPISLASEDLGRELNDGLRALEKAGRALA